MALTLNEKIFIAFIWLMLLGFLVCMGIIDHSFGSLFDNLDGPISCGSPDSPVSNCVSCLTSRTGCTIDLCDIKNMKVATKVALWSAVIAFILYTGMLVWYYMATKGTVGGSTPASGGTATGTPSVATLQTQLEQAKAQAKSAQDERDRLRLEKREMQVESDFNKKRLEAMISQKPEQQSVVQSGAPTSVVPPSTSSLLRTVTQKKSLI